MYKTKRHAVLIATGVVFLVILAFLVSAVSPAVKNARENVIFFAFTTILGWDYYSEKCLEYLTDSQRSVKIYRWIYILAVFIGPYLTVEAVWNIANIFNGLMAFPNLIALFALSGVVGKETRAYFAEKNHDLKEISREHK